MNNSLLYALAILLLLLTGGMAALTVFRKVDVSPKLYRATGLLGLGLGACVLVQSLFQPDGLHFGMLLGLMCVFWLAALVAWAEGFIQPLLLFDVLAFPLCALAFVLYALLGQEPAVRMAGDALFQFHLLIALAAYSLLSIAAGHALIMVFQERVLHHPSPSSAQQRQFHERFLDLLPPLIHMERTLFRVLSVGFWLLTCTLVTGVAFSESSAGVLGQLNHKTVFSVLSWLLFGTLLLGRRVWGWRGKVALRWCLVSYVVLFLAYFGTQFVLEFVLKRVG